MTNKSTKKALLLSVLSMLLCVAMLVGTTFAWFTDSVTSGKNKIVAGNLDIELEYSKTPDVDNSWETVKDATDLLNKDALWEPGHAEVVYLKLSNLGTLALKYQFSMNVFDTTPGVSVLGNEIHLADYLEYGIVDYTAKFETREEAIAAVKNSAKPLDNYAVNGTMTTKGETKTLALVVYMPTTVGNEANYRGTQIPTIELGVELKATQLAYESDFFGTDYDENAPWVGGVSLDWYTANPTATEFTISTAEELAGFAQIVNGTAVVGSTLSLRSTPVTLHDDFNGKTVKLDKDIDLNDLAWTPIGRIGTTSTDFTYSFRGTFDGQNHTVKNLVSSGYGWVGLFGIAYKADINNVKLDGVKLDGNRMTGSLVGQLYGSIDNCHVNDAYIKVIPNALGDSFDNGDKVGGIVGWLGDNGNNRTLTNCSATNIDVIGYRDVGGIAGYVASSTVIKNNSATKVRITIDQLTNHYGDKDTNAGLIYGRTGGAVVDDGSNKADAESVINQSYLKDGLQLKNNSSTGETVLYLVPSDYAKDTVKVPEGVTTIGNFAFAYNSNVETVELPSTVTDLGRGFDTSTVKKVVLNEGLQTISNRAFKATTALEEVVISSTVTVIADNAFQKSGIKSIIIPANVETVGETAFGASKIETVIFEGNTSIQGYAFRGCPNLRTVYLNGDNTFIPSTLNGRDSTWFCNGESNNPNTSSIIFYVKNDTVAARVKAAMGAEANNTTVIVGNVEVTKDPEVIKDALASGKDVVLTEDVEVTAAQSTIAPYGNKTAVTQNGGVFDGNGKDISLDMGGDNYTVMTAGGTIKNLNVVGGFRGIMIMSPTETVRIDNVYVGGPSVGYALNTGEGDSTQDLVVTNSSFYGWNSWSLLKSASFTNCTFGQGTYWGATSVFGRLARPYVDTVFTNCAFDAEGYILDISSLNGTIDLVDCTLMGVKVTAENFADLVDLTDLASGGASLMAKVKVNGVLVFDEANQ